MTIHLRYIPAPFALLPLLCLALGWAGAARAQTPSQPDQTTAAMPVVVELFTSESCTMCPPADAFLAELAESEDVLALSFHVTLWDSLGWSDPLALASHMQRQKTYNRRLRRRAPYTPQMVIDGEAIAPGGKRKLVLKAIDRMRRSRSKTVPIEITRADPGALAITIGAGEDVGTEGIVYAAYFRDYRNVTVGGGGNDGGVATYMHAVYALEHAADWTGAPLSLDLPTALDGTGHPDGVAILLQSSDQGRMLGAAAITMPPPS